MRRLSLLLFGLLLAASCSSPHGKTALYEQYEHCDDIKAACLIGYAIDREHRVDVTILQAHNAAAFERLMSDMGLTTAGLSVGKVIVSGRAVGPDGKPRTQTFGASVTYRTVYVFQCDEEASQYLTAYLAKKMNNYINDKK